MLCINLRLCVEVEGLEHIEYLPIMDYKNKSISLENVTSFDVNKSIQRSLTKALDRHGLGFICMLEMIYPRLRLKKAGGPAGQVAHKVKY